jgi:hypothetical protein
MTRITLSLLAIVCLLSAEWSDGTRELYDHSTDSEETRNVSEANAEIVKTLSQQVQALKVGQTSSVGKAQ